MTDPAVDPRPLPGPGRRHRGRCAAQLGRPRPGRRAGRLPAILGGRAPPRARRGVVVHAGAGGADRRGHVADPGRLRRGAAAGHRRRCRWPSSSARSRRCTRAGVDLGLGRFDLHKILRLAGTAPQPGCAAAACAARPGGGRAADPAAGPVPRGPRRSSCTSRGCWGYARTTRPRTTTTQVGAILDYLGGAARRPDGQPVTVPAAEGADLDVWVLGSSPGESAQVAGARGLPFAASYHTSPSTVLETVEAYRRRVPAVGAARRAVRGGLGGRRRRRDPGAGARSWPRPYAQWVLDIRTGIGARPYVTPEQAKAREWTDGRAGDRRRPDRHPVRRLARGRRRAADHARPRHRRRRAAGHHDHHRARRPRAQHRAAGAGLVGTSRTEASAVA